MITSFIVVKKFMPRVVDSKLTYERAEVRGIRWDEGGESRST